MKEQERLRAVRMAPFTASIIDTLTGAERHLQDLLDLPFVGMVKNCFPKILPSKLVLIHQVWTYSIAAFHLRQPFGKSNGITTKDLRRRAARIYELEMQRSLGAIFPLEHPFWQVFYRRQDKELEKALIVLDALHYCSTGESQIPYQLLLQVLKAILRASYLEPENSKDHYQNAQNLIVTLPLSSLNQWLEEQKNDLL